MTTQNESPESHATLLRHLNVLVDALDHRGAHIERMLARIAESLKALGLIVLLVDESGAVTVARDERQVV
jgi:hypothetical protein